MPTSRTPHRLRNDARPRVGNTSRAMRAHFLPYFCVEEAIVCNRGGHRKNTSTEFMISMCSRNRKLLVDNNSQALAAPCNYREWNTNRTLGIRRVQGVHSHGSDRSCCAVSSVFDRWSSMSVSTKHQRTEIMRQWRPSANNFISPVFFWLISLSHDSHHSS